MTQSSSHEPPIDFNSTRIWCWSLCFFWCNLPYNWCALYKRCGNLGGCNSPPNDMMYSHPSYLVKHRPPLCSNCLLLITTDNKSKHQGVTNHSGCLAPESHVTTHMSMSQACAQPHAPVKNNWPKPRSSTTLAAPARHQQLIESEINDLNQDKLHVVLIIVYNVPQCCPFHGLESL